jgi:hypothetical protein
MSDIKEMKKRILKDVEQQIDAMIESSDGTPRSLYELEMKIVAIGERAKKRIAEEIIKYQQDQDSKKKLPEMRKTAL